MANKNPNIEGLLSHSKEKNKIAKNKVDAAIKKMIKEKMMINFNTVSSMAGVSKAFLYKEIELRKQIETLRSQQEGLKSGENFKRNISDKSKDVIIETLKNKINSLNLKIKSLEQQNGELKQQLKKDLGKLYQNL
ncbi:hypothetical protein SAMN04487943_106268 [Gracilibacillus orientalis]|uniref:Transposase n=1 Tax=Gracilibacillus orientalis TaxID=334253 RepID=A0A1I4MI33_9BACI|nr:DUF6262 family protein [Gracilibacillus orientalis]SFM02710.1 hypothetical protein SAMN04487943_106268 [Gracilibacillus orientalis]